MQEVTPWPSDFDVSEPVARVLVDGTEVDVESVTVSSELDSAMPERVIAGGGIVAATGTVSVLRSDDVTETGFNPWGDAQSFVDASEIVVEAGYRDPETGEIGCARQLTGQVESLAGSAGSPTLDMEVSDRTPTLDRPITLEPLLTRYPALEDFGPTRLAGLLPIYIRDRVLRHCGFYATPPMVSQALLSVPFTGSAVPERGNLLEGEVHTFEKTMYRPSAWGVGVANGIFRFAPNLGTRGHARLSSTLHVSFLRDRDSITDPYGTTVELRWGSRNDRIDIAVSWRGNLSVEYVQGGNATRVTMLQAADVTASEAFTVLISPAGQATIHASNGATVTGTVPLPSRLTSQSMDEIYVRASYNSHPIGGLQVAFTEATITGFERTSHLDRPVHLRSFEAFPFQGKVNCLDVLKEQANAELAAMWIDEYGHFRWRNRVNLRITPISGTLTSKHHLLDLSWDIPIRSVFSRVEVEHAVPRVALRGVPSITVSDRSGTTLLNGDTDEWFIEPPGDQDWHMVEAPQWLGGTVDYSKLRRGIGSYRGGIVVDDNNNERLAYSSRLTQSWSRINPQRWLLSSTAHGLNPTEYIEQAFRDRPDIYGRFATNSLPLLRAKGLVTWEEGTTTGAARGPQFAPTYTHQAGAWIQGATELQEMTDWLAEQLTKPEPVLRRVPIVPDPRIQLGDVFWLEDQSAYHVRLRVVVMGTTLTYRASGDGHEMTQEITCRVISVQRQHVRYDELEAAWAGRDYTAFAAAWDGVTYDGLESAPLDRS